MPTKRKPLFPGLGTPEGNSDMANAGLGTAMDIFGAFTADEQYQGGATGKAIGGGIGALAGSLIPGGTQIGQMIGSTIGGLIGGSSDKDKAEKAMVTRRQRKNMALNLVENVDPYGQYADGGVVGEGGGGGTAKPVTAPQGYKPSNPQQRGNWNKFIDYLNQKKIGGSPDLDVRDQSLGLTHLNNYNKEFPDAAIDPSFIPTAQYEANLIRKQGTFPGMDPKTAKFAFGELPENFRNSNISEVDGWLGSLTSKQYYPSYKRTSKDGAIDYGTDFETYAKSGLTMTAPSDVLSGNRMVASYADGGMIGEAPSDPQSAQAMEEAPPVMINIERGELLVGPDMTIITEFKNPNQYSPHASNPYKEPHGNFVERPEGSIVIPKKLAKGYKEGNEITRGSILKQILKEQSLDPNFNSPVKDAEGTYGDGGQVGKILKGKYFNTRPNVLGPTDPADPVMSTANQGQYAGITDVNPISNEGYAMGDFKVPAIEEAPAQNGTNWGAVGRRAMAFLPGALQAVQASQGDPDLAPVFNSGFDRARASIGQMDTTVNINDQIADIDQQAAAALKGVSNANTPSARAEAANIMSTAAQAKGRVRAEAGRQGTGLRNNKLAQMAQLESNQGQSNQQEQLRVQNESRMNAASRRNTIANATVEAYQNYAKMNNDDRTIDMLNHISKFVDINPLANQVISEDPEAMKRIMASVNEHLGTMSMEDAVAKAVQVETSRAPKNIKITSVENKQDKYGLPAGSKTKRTNILK